MSGNGGNAFWDALERDGTKKGAGPTPSWREPAPRGCGLGDLLERNLVSVGH